MRIISDGLENIISLNKRNLDVISVYNKRVHFPIVDDKIKTKEYLEKGDGPFPKTISIIHNVFDIASYQKLLSS